MRVCLTILSSITAETSTAHDGIKITNEQIAVLQRKSAVVLHFPTLAYDSLQLACSTDGSVTNRAEKSSQIGILTRADDKNGAMRVVSFRSCKAWRVCRSAMALETFAFVEGFDSTLALGSQLSQMLALESSILVLTYSHSRFNMTTTQSARRKVV
jgi:hypothetical protein